MGKEESVPIYISEESEMSDKLNAYSTEELISLYDRLRSEGFLRREYPHLAKNMVSLSISRMNKFSI